MTKENALTFYLKRQGVFLKDQDDFFLPWCYEVNHETALFLIENQTVCRS
jgi:hypothetical protein